MHSLSINLAFLPIAPTGLATYAINLLPHLKSLDPALLIAQKKDEFECYSVPNNLTHEQGRKGHLSRLLWTQFQAPKLYQKHDRAFYFLPFLKLLYGLIVDQL